MIRAQHGGSTAEPREAVCDVAADVIQVHGRNVRTPRPASAAQRGYKTVSQKSPLLFRYGFRTLVAAAAPRLGVEFPVELAERPLNLVLADRDGMHLPLW